MPFARLVVATTVTAGMSAALVVESTALEGGLLARTQVLGVAIERAEPAAIAVTPVPASAVARAAGGSVTVKPVARKAAPAAKLTPTRGVRPRSTTTSTRATAAATTSSYIRGCDGTSGWQKRRGAYAMRRITYNWRKTGYTIVFLAARRGLTGMTYPGTRRIEVYVRSCSRMTNAYLAETVAHEIGHAVDFTLGTNAWQRKWQLARHISLSTPWYGAPYAADFATPAGDFAETFGAWQVPDGPNDSTWGRPNAAELALLIPLLNP